MSGVNRNVSLLDQFSYLYLVQEPNLPKPEYRIGVNCCSSLLSLALPSLLTHSSGYTPGGDSYHFPINFLFLLSLRPPFSLSSLTPSCTTWFSVPCLKKYKAVSFPPAFETHKSADFFSPYPCSSYPSPPTLSPCCCSA